MLNKINVELDLPEPPNVTSWGEELSVIVSVDEEFKQIGLPVFIFEHCQATFKRCYTLFNKRICPEPMGEDWVYTCADADGQWWTRGCEYDPAD